MATPGVTFAPSNTDRNNIVPSQTRNQLEPNTQRVTSCCENPLLKKIGVFSLTIITSVAHAALAIGLGAGAYFLFHVSIVVMSNPPLFIATVCLAALVALTAIHLMTVAIAVPILFANYI